VQPGQAALAAQTGLVEVRDGGGGDLGAHLGQERDEIVGRAGGGRGHRGRRHRCAEQVREGVGGPLAGQELPHEQVHHDRLGPRPVLHRRVHPARRSSASDGPASTAPRDDLVLDHMHLDRRDVEHLRPLGAHHGRTGQVGPAPAALGRFVAHHDVGVRHLMQRGSLVAHLPTGPASGRLAQRLRGRLAQTVRGRRLGGVPRVRTHLGLELTDPGLERPVLLTQCRYFLLQCRQLLTQHRD